MHSPLKSEFVNIAALFVSHHFNKTIVFQGLEQNKFGKNKMMMANFKNLLMFLEKVRKRFDETKLSHGHSCVNFRGANPSGLPNFNPFLRTFYHG